MTALEANGQILRQKLSRRRRRCFKRTESINPSRGIQKHRREFEQNRQHGEQEKRVTQES